MKIKVFVSWRVAYTGREPEVFVCTDNYEDVPISGYSQTREIEVDIGDVPPFDKGIAVAAAVAELRKEKADLLKKVDQIEDKIARLAALEYRPEEVAP